VPVSDVDKDNEASRVLQKEITREEVAMEKERSLHQRGGLGCGVFCTTTWFEVAGSQKNTNLVST